MSESTTTRTKASDYLESSFREKLLEHVFISELLQEAWLGRGQTLEVLRSEVDSAGYDLAIEFRGVLRYIQLKSSRSDAKTSRQTVNARLAEKPGGCVVWLVYEEVDRRAKLQYLFFGGDTTERPALGEKIGIHAKANAQGIKSPRPNTRVLTKSRFTEFSSVGQLMDKLFGLGEFSSIG